MVHEQFNPQPSGLPSVLMEIKALEQEIYQGGSVDIEKDQLKKIMNDLLVSHTITPEQALLAVQGIKAARQDYH